MSTHLPLLVLLAMSVLPMQDVTPRAVLLAARDLAYDANYRNDQEGLRSAIDRLQPLASSSSDSAYAHYYLSWAFGALSASQLLASDSAATASATRALEHARRGLEARATDPEFHVVLANSLIGVMFTDKSQFAAALSELRQVRQKALGLDPKNPRVVQIDAGIIFNDPSEPNGHERGIARLNEALRFFDVEAESKSIDPLAPRWGHASALATLATFYLRLTPAQTEQARAAAETALRLRPDFWYVHQQVLPLLKRSKMP